MRRGYFVAWALLMLTGCAPRMPHLAAPDKIQNLRISPALVAGRSTTPAQSDWWRSLLNPAEQKILQLALSKNPDLAVAEARVRLAAADLREAGAQLLPQVQTSGQVGISQWTKNQFYLPPYAGETSWNNALKLDFSYNLDIGGQEQARAKVAQYRLGIAEQRRRAAVLLLENAVLQQMLAVRADAAILAELHQEQTLLLQIQEIEKERYQQGLTDSLIALGYAQRISSLQEDIVIQQAKVRKNRQALAVLCGVGTRLPRDLSATPVLMPLSGWQIPRQIPAAWIAGRPDVLARRSAIEAAAEAIHVARDAYYPNVNIVAFAGGLAAAGSLFTFLHPGSLQAGVGPAISLPLFTGGRLRGKFDAAQADYHLALAQYQQSLLQALQQVTATLTDLQAAGEERTSLDQRDQLLQLQRRLQQQRYQAGLNNALPELEVKLTLIDNQLQQTRLNARARQSLINMYASLGGRVIPDTWSRHRQAP